MSDFQEVLEAGELLAQGRPDRAILVLEPYGNRYPGNAQAWFLLGVAYHQTGKTEAALHSLERVISIEPRHVQARSAKGAVLCDLGRYREAFQVYRKALHLAPLDAQLLVNLGIVLEQLRDNLGALERYEQALKSQPDFAAALQNRNGMDAHFPERHQSAKVVVLSKPTQPERSVRNEDYDNWYRFGKGSISDSRDRYARQNRASQTTAPGRNGQVLY